MPRTQQPSTGLGIEDELSFGSDEDLIADVGEIALPATVPDSLSNAKADKDKKSRFKLSGKKKSEEASALASAHSQSSTREMRDTSRKKEKKSKEGFSLASASIVLDPQMESVLDLTSGGAYYNAGSASGGSTPSLPSLTSGSTTSSRKKGGFRNALKGLGMKKESEQNSHFVTRQREKLDKLKQVHSIDSFSTGEYSMQPSIDLSLSTYSSRRTDTTMSSVYHHLTPTNMPGTKSRAEREDSLHSKHASVSSVTPSQPPSYANTDRQPPAHNHKMILEKFPEGAASKQTIPLNSPSSLSSRTPSPFLSPALTSIILPSFPTSPSSLENIQILSATVIRRTHSSSIGKEKSSSLRNLAGGLANGSSPSKKPVWVSQQMILTSFKIGGNTPVGSPNPEAAPVITSESGTDVTKTTAHLHLFSIPTTSPRSSLKSSTSPVKPSPPQPQVELERMMLKADSTAGFWEEASGERKFVMRIGFGYGEGEEKEGEGVEWIVEMRNAEQLREWIQQIKSIAVVIRAEKEGHGHAIREAFSSGSARGDDLALALNMQRLTPSHSITSRPTSYQSGSTGTPLRNSVSSPIGRPPRKESLPEAPTPSHAPVSIAEEDKQEAAKEESPMLLPEEIRGRLERLDLGLYTPPTRGPNLRQASETSLSSARLNQPIPAKLPPPTVAPPSIPDFAVLATQEKEKKDLTEAEKIRLEAQVSTPVSAAPVSDLAGPSNTLLAPEQAADAQSIHSIPSVSSKTSTTGSRKRAAKKMALDIMSEFNESGMGDFEVEEEVPINEDRARAVRFV
ncbi:hypothetical protein C343_06872 [Cryptococcus neoformans C23]|uniref:Uncharacterized protein n=1 Tax=Cryptococcus neoformans (strain H99 / ATCC 208821 / CBS 10515 / FGSC 9487) TaxID=235443 RepID=J9VZN2_CRYN9|nr:hypothetical protein CNAG_05452 [Cryptococcus neoformans var. grubii H99]AFR98881.1 hypothetical protein CNAG_05452 [Cryptococcus neoformans var. grubii H99]AUB29092.1 hypothetical protein CKF44_05452 [Cryptococcus neoformans var. grubii]OWZ38166.1 hypothetical protein C343_06872 [Cryptococcus neoformans var. grubii C23]|eukprot:XP_012053781.1 hypothetical protein CNAG_05452 [Cryptococcus neoformans var. grubii H99]